MSRYNSSHSLPRDKSKPSQHWPSKMVLNLKKKKSTNDSLFTVDMRIIIMYID